MNAVTILAVLALTRVAAAQVTVEAFGIDGGRAEPRVPEFHVFGGQPTEFNLAVEAPLGAKVALTADLFQLTKGLAAPLGAGLRLGEDVDFAKQTRRIVRAALPLPEVRGKTEILARVHAQLEGEAKPARVGEARLFVYPRDQARELADFLRHLERETRVRPAVFGESPRLRAFFKSHDLPFLDCGAEWPREWDQRVLYLGEASTESPAPRETRAAGAQVLVFSAEPGTLPGVYRSTLRGLTITKVTLPILATLTTNPQSQQIFADLLHQCLQPDPP